jgi:MFS transporter, ACS family, tartrate transporter
MTPLHRKIAARLVPFLMLLYMIAYLDRVNISFAALTMNRDLGISDSVYGFAAGVFFLSYCLLEVPANLMLARVGARRWLAILVVVWGVVSAGTAFVGNPGEYIVARCLLGVAESGFFPGVIFYLTLWLPRHLRARIMALFLLAVSACNILGSPVSSNILLLDGIGRMHGWQWLFILEGVPAILLGMASWFVLADGPQTALWLSPAEKDEHAAEMRAGEPLHGPVGGGSIHLQVALDAVAYLVLQVGFYGLGFWLPKLLASKGVSTAATGWWAALPYAAGGVTMVVLSHRTGKWWLAAMYLTAAAGFAWAALANGLVVSVAAYSLATAGMFGSLPLFWSSSTARMNSKVAGAAIATVNSIGVLGGFAGPYAMGRLHDLTHSYSPGLWLIAVTFALGIFTVRGGIAGSQTA